ncbi:MAG: MoaD/ThiS family protein [Gemmatimonadales bacterium]
MIRVELPEPLRNLARIEGDILVDAGGSVTQHTVLSALESRYPALRGTMRDQITRKRRPFLRFFACGQDLSHEEPDAPLPDAVARGEEPYLVVGATAGG